MKKQDLTIRILCASLALWFALIACGLPNSTRVGELKSETQSADLESATSARAQIEFPAGDVNLPAAVGVLVAKETALVNVSADGLNVDGNGYVNRAYGTAPYTLILKLQAGVGSVVLIAP